MKPSCPSRISPTCATVLPWAVNASRVQGAPAKPVGAFGSGAVVVDGCPPVAPEAPDDDDDGATVPVDAAEWVDVDVVAVVACVDVAVDAVGLARPAGRAAEEPQPASARMAGMEKMAASAQRISAGRVCVRRV